jgi:hypothetical protein
MRIEQMDKGNLFLSDLAILDEEELLLEKRSDTVHQSQYRDVSIRLVLS